LEDIGFEAIDNPPLGLVPGLVDRPVPRLALGIDTRNRDFSTAAFVDLVDQLRRRQDIDVSVLYLDCSPGVLLQRYSETRRRHPMAPSESPETGIGRELRLLAPVRDLADTLVDTSALNVHQLREQIERWFAPDGQRQLALSVQSFAYRRGLPGGADMVFDCRFLANPHWVPDLRRLDGRDPAVAEHVTSDPRFAPFFDRVSGLVDLLLPAFRAEGKAHLTVAFGCTGGQHRSVVLAEALAKGLAKGGWPVSLRHRELAGSDRGGGAECLGS
jgi:UPF0042 nucleotide-binding protein